MIYFRVKKKKAQILAADDAPIYVDDDYYWRNGWYNNPVDPRLIVPDRFLRDELYYQLWEDLTGKMVEVDMEQMFLWNPDIIYIGNIPI